MLFSENRVSIPIIIICTCIYLFGNESPFSFFDLKSKTQTHLSHESCKFLIILETISIMYRIVGRKHEM